MGEVEMMPAPLVFPGYLSCHEHTLAQNS